MGNSFKLAPTICITPTYMLLLYLIGLLSIAHEEGPMTLCLVSWNLCQPLFAPVSWPIACYVTGAEN